MSQLFSLQGRVEIGTRLANGKPGPMYWAGNVPSAQLELTAESTPLYESFSGNRGLYGSFDGTKAAKFTGIFNEWLTKNLALGLHATVLAQATGSVTGELLPDDLAAGDIVALDHPFASAIALTDSATPPVPVTTANYAPHGLNSRLLEITSDLATYTQPIKAAYTYADYESIDVFSQTPRETYVIFDGINTETGDGVVIDMYRAKFAPFANLGLIQTEYGALDFSADLLVDPLNFDVNGRGGFVRMRRKALT